jgi:epoxyqueuosine reductase
MVPCDHTSVPASSTVDSDSACAVGLAAGLAAVGVASAEPFTSTRRDLEQRRSQGLHAGMQFTYRNPARSTEPERVLDGARALVVGAHAYRPTPPPRPEGAVGRVAAYAREDHYGALRVGLEAIAEHLTGAGHHARIVADDNALVDREAARRAGIGWYGKNTNLLISGRGSWTVLGSVVTDAPLEPAAALVGDGCGSCRRCLDGCPTGAIVAPGVVDARRCLAWLVQADGPFPPEFRAALGDRLYGCDDCQEVCPPNQRVERGEPVAIGAEPTEAWVDLVELLAASDDDLLDRHGRWYIPRRDPRYLRRNALVALGNGGDLGDPGVVAVVDAYRTGDDALLAEHADWARSRLVDRAAGLTS